MMKLSPYMPVEKGVESLLLAADLEGIEQGAYFGPKWLVTGRAKHIRLPKSVRKSDLERIWKVGEELTGVKSPLSAD